MGKLKTLVKMKHGNGLLRGNPFKQTHTLVLPGVKELKR
jgi:hypothetical protein